MDILVVLLAFIVGIVITAVGGWAYSFLRKPQGYPYESLIESAILPYVMHAILFAYRESERNMDAVGERLEGIDKRRIAGRIYDLLPDYLPVGGYAVDIRFIKSIVSRELFERLVDRAFENFLHWYEKVYARYEEMLRDEMPIFETG